MTITYDDDIRLDELDPDHDVWVRTGRGGEVGAFHIYEDCSNAASSMSQKAPEVLYDDMTLCPFCRYRLEQDEGVELAA